VKHFDEHTLELYVLNSAAVARKRRSIERHLGECHGCRQTVQLLEEFYVALRQELPDDSPVRAQLSTALSRRSPKHPDVRPADAPVLRSRLERSFSSLRLFARRHPLASTSAVFAALAVLALVTTIVVPRRNAAPNPAYVSLNSEAQCMEVYDAANQLAWTLPSKMTYSYADQERDIGTSATIVYDLDRDGRNEVLSAISPLGAGESSRSSVSYISSSGDIIKRVELGRSFKYADRLFADDFATSGLAIVTINQNPVVVATLHHFRSPTAVISLDAQGKLLGEYWHYGRLLGPYSAASAEFGPNALVLTGSNDVGDTEGRDFPIAVVVDAGKLQGVRQGTESSGFGYPVSEAEIYKIRFPKTDMDLAAKAKPGVLRFLERERGGEHILLFRVVGRSHALAWSFDYVFSEAMDLLEVKSSDSNPRSHAELKRQGLVRGTIDARYLERLAEGVQYWDGSAWKHSKSRVSHP
jgi:hypothetical protein